MSVRSTGWTNGVSANVAGTGVDWVNPTNADASDDAYATAALSFPGTPSTDYLRTTQFGFAIPTTAKILGIQARYEKSRSGETFNTTAVYLVVGGALAGDDQGLSDAWPLADAVTTYGAADDLWGVGALTPAQVNATDFGVQVKGESVTSGTGQVDNVQLNVWYETVDVPFTYPEIILPRRIPSKYPLWVPAGCQLYYDFEDWGNKEGGKILDHSGYGRHGTNYGTTGGASNDKAGLLGRVRGFDGSDDYISAGDVAALDFGTGDFSVEVWVKLITGIGTYKVIVGKINGAIDGFSLRHSTTGRFEFLIDQPAGAGAIVPSPTPDYRDSWRHVVCVADRDTLHSVYVDSVSGASDATDTSGWDLTGTDNFMVGASFLDSVLGRLSLMDIGLVRLYNRALTALEVRALYRASAWRFYKA